MRLGQLARKLNIDTKEIVSFLEKENITIEHHLNTKLEDDQIELVSNAFVQETEEEVEVQSETQNESESEAGESSESESEKQNESVEEVQSEEQNEKEVKEEEEITVEIYELPDAKEEPAIAPSSEENLTVSELLEKEGVAEGEEPVERDITELSREEAVPEDIEAPVIRKPKVELQGIKVVGKIELPEKPVKEEPKNPDASGEQVEDSTPAEPVEEGPAIHPTKKTKLVEVERTFIPDEDLPQEEEVKKPKKAKEIKAEKKAAEKKNKKKKKKAPVKPELSPEAIAKQKIRDKRRRQRKNAKEASAKKEVHWLKRLWDAIK